MTRRLVLVGAGLANLHLLRAWCRRPLPGVELVLVTPGDSIWYSGMVPGYLHGAYEAPMLRIDLGEMARAVGARLLTAAADRVRAEDRVVEAGGESLAYDACSLDVGAAAAGQGLPGVREHAVALRPMENTIALRDRVDALAASSRPFSLVVVGAGPSGVEVALALHQRATAAGGPGSVTLADAARTLLPGAPDALQARAAAILEARGIGTALGSRVTEVRRDSVRLASGALLPAELTVWLTGPAAPPLAAASELPRDAEGWIRVDRSLQVVGHPGLFAAGDCAAVEGTPAAARSGASAARQGPVLVRSVRAALGVGRPGRYRPRRRTLSILDTADGRAILRWGMRYGHGAWAWWLKRAIDRRFVRAQRLVCDERPVRDSLSSR